MTAPLRRFLPSRGGPGAKLAAVVAVLATSACLIAALSGPWWYTWRAWGIALLAAAAGFAVLWAARPPAPRFRTDAGVRAAPPTGERGEHLVSEVVDLMDHLPTEALRYRVGQALQEAGVSQFGADGETFDPSRHMVIGLEPTVDATQNDRVARTLGPGFADATGVLKPARVSLYRLEAPEKVGGR